MGKREEEDLKKVKNSKIEIKKSIRLNKKKYLTFLNMFLDLINYRLKSLKNI